MQVIITPSLISGVVTAPPSKSFTHRAIIAASLAAGKTLIKNPLLSEDTKATIEACRSLGTDILLDQDKIIIKGTGGLLKAKSKVIDCGNSGTTMRFITAIACLSTNPITLTGSKRLCQRPIGELTAVLTKLGAKIEFLHKRGFLPLKLVGGQLGGGVYKLSGKESSQYISALLLLAPYLRKPLTLLISGQAKSRPYIDITIEVMKSFAALVKRQSYCQIKVNPGKYQGRTYQIEGDFTQAAYFFAAAALTGGDITVKKLNYQTVQGDRIFINLLKKLGFNFKIKKANSFIQIIAKKDHLSTHEKTISLNLSDNPDLVQTTAVVAAFRAGKTKITNIEHLKLKETDRIADTALELKKMGVKSKIDKDKLIIYGDKPKGAEINPHGDHRMAMAFAVLGLAAEGKTTISHAEVVNKSYPTFWQDLAKVGANLTII